MDDKTTLIDAQADVDGVIKGKDVHILGRFKGEITLSGRLVLGDSARVDAKVSADAADISGEFKGELKVRSLLLHERARVEGTLDAETLAVKEGAYVNGSVNARGRGNAKPVPPVAAPTPVKPPQGAVAG